MLLQRIKLMKALAFHMNPKHALLKCKQMVNPVILIHYEFSQSNNQSNKPNANKQQEGTQYTNWVLSRSANFNHDISYLRRKHSKDRYNIHKLTNLDFMCEMVNRHEIYELTVNQNILLLGQMNHVCNVLGKDKGIFVEFHCLSDKIAKGIHNPEDFICVGTYINTLSDLGDFAEWKWIEIVDALFVRKYDEEYDELYGLYTGLQRYKQNVVSFNDYTEIQKNKVIHHIPIIYRNSLEVLRQYIKFNVYNLKQCRLLCRCLYENKINESYFWESVSDWFNIYIKEQLSKKVMEQFFIVSEATIEKMLFDDGMIRPRSVLQEIAEISYILSSYRIISWRYISFVETLIIYSIENGSDLYHQYLQTQQSTTTISLNSHIRTKRQSEDKALNQMQQSYQTLFVNPTEISSESIIHLLIVLKRSYMDEIIIQKTSPSASGSTSTSTSTRNGYDVDRSSLYIDNRVIQWLMTKICKESMNYTINELLKIIECQQFLALLKLDLSHFIKTKIKFIRDPQCTLNDLKSILTFLPLLEFNTLENILQTFLYKAHPNQILNLTRLFENQSLTIKDFDLTSTTYDVNQKAENNEKEKEEEEILEKSVKQRGKKEQEWLGRSDSQKVEIHIKQAKQKWIPYLSSYFLCLPQAVNKHEKYYSFDENCYFLYILLKNQEYWDALIGSHYLGEMEKLKNSVKTASYSRGFKLQFNSYFYKLLNYVDLVTFFDGG